MFNTLFPLPVLFSALFPLLIGLFINSKTYSFHQLKVLLLWTPILVAPYIFTRKKFYLYFATIPLLLIGSVELFHWSTIGGPANVASWYVIFETNIFEAWEFFITQKSLLLIVIPLYLVSSIIFLRYYKSNKIKLTKIEQIIVTVVLFSFVLIVVLRTANSKILKTIPSVIHSSYEYAEEIREVKILNEEIKMGVFDIDANALNKDKEQLHVLILGESTGRNHMRLYGYNRNTSPLLSSRDDLFIFQDVICPNVHSQPAIKKLITLSNNKNHIDYTDSPNILNMFSSAGYYSYWISNQAPIGIWDNLISLMAKSANQTIFVNFSGNSINVLDQVSYDEKLFKPLQKVLKETKNPKKFLVLHLMGTHMFYKYRYPKKFNVFSADDEDSKEQIIAEYDNAVLYNDFIVNEIIEEVKAYSDTENVIASIIYISDHGDDVYDVNDYAGHDWYSMSYPMVEIPFIVWVSDEYKRVYHDKTSFVKSNLDKGYMTDDLFHSMLDISGIESSYFKPELSIFSNKFIEQDRYINNKFYSIDNKFGESSISRIPKNNE